MDKKPKSYQELKFQCPYCGRKMLAEGDLFGQGIVCQECGMMISVPYPEGFVPYGNPFIEKKDSGTAGKGGRSFTVKNGKRTGGAGKKRRKPPVRKKSRRLMFRTLFVVAVIISGLIIFSLFWNADIKPIRNRRIPASVAKRLKDESGCVLPKSATLSLYGNFTSPRHRYIRIEAESPEMLEGSCEIDDDADCSGGKYMVIREGVGSGWMKRNQKKTKANAIYKFTAPEDGEYYLWARTKWEGGCSNAFFVYIDDLPAKNRKGFIQKGDPHTLGKDTTFHVWHWYCRHVVSLRKGTHTLTVKNQDDGSKVDMFLLTDDKSYVPHETGKWITDIPGRNWVGDNIDWKFSHRYGKEILQKKRITASPILSKLEPSKPYYLSFKASGCSVFRIIFDYQNQGNYSSMEFYNGEIKIKTKKEGKWRKREANLFSPDSVTNKHLAIEFFRYKKKATLVINNVLALSVPLAEKTGNQIAIDMNKDGKLSDIKITPVEPIHLGACHYAEFGQSPYFDVYGKWRSKSRSFRTETEDALAVTGEQWWRNYQVSCMIKIPNFPEGASGPGIYYRDKNNYYWLKVTSEKIKLVRVLNSITGTLGFKKISIAKGKWHRLTLNIFDGNIQVFLNGKKIIEAKDKTFFSGKSFFLAKRSGTSKNDVLRFDDIMISNLQRVHAGDTNEALPFIKIPGGVRILNLVMDSYGATGGLHPGDYSGSRTESELSKIMKRLTGADYENRQVSCVDFQMLTFAQRSFRELHYNDGRRKGFIQAISSSSDTRKYLWGNMNLFGDWEFSFMFEGKADNIGVLVQEMTGFPMGSDQYIFDYSISNGKLKKEKYLKLLPCGDKANLSGTEWHKISVRKELKELIFSIDNIDIGKYDNLQENIFLRLAVFFRNGELSLDNIFTYVNPDFFYIFQYNQVWRLALSDWKTSCEEKKREHHGGYYSYLEIPSEDKRACLESKRVFTGDITIMLYMDLEKNKIFALNLVPYGQEAKEQKFVMTNNCVAYYDGDNEVSRKPLKNLFSEQRRYTDVLLRIEHNYAKLYLNDDKGTQRLVMLQKIALPKTAEYRIKLTADPSLKIQKIFIWGEEAE